MSGRFPWFKMTASTVGLIGIGWALMRTTVPTPEETYNAMAPDLRKKVDANRAARLAQEDATKRQVNAQLNDPDASKPIWADSKSR